MAEQQISNSALNELELRTLEAVFHQIAPIIDALLKDSIPYTKMYSPTPPMMEVPSAIP